MSHEVASRGIPFPVTHKRMRAGVPSNSLIYINKNEPSMYAHNFRMAVQN